MSFSQQAIRNKERNNSFIFVGIFKTNINYIYLCLQVVCLKLRERESSLISKESKVSKIKTKIFNFLNSPLFFLFESKRNSYNNWTQRKWLMFEPSLYSWVEVKKKNITCAKKISLGISCPTLSMQERKHWKRVKNVKLLRSLTKSKLIG